MLKIGTRIKVSGLAKDLWITELDKNMYVESEGVISETPKKDAKKVKVILFDCGSDKKYREVYIRISCIKEIKTGVLLEQIYAEQDRIIV
ncbi:MAG: hypothetical protein IJZ36_00865, partial [Bacilli bacterium]|nr:hypothetical protein [Bacilli bacterium]